jgi:aspartate/methionine/tyrosine aminotransferase
VAGLNEIPGVECRTPKGAFYAFPRVSGTGLTGKELADRLLAEADVCVLAGTAFGGVGVDHVRISYANSRENLTKALGRIGDFVAGLPACAVTAGAAR